ncbi:phosphatase PAP2 family protein [Sphingomonas oligophenolica]|uniref:Phosphatase PAP2 family protein n=2 Tax=Sphingomonas oligophenolica TaxID=301154 RepID=A0A502CDS2_9SPHN|nr:phosphatase PAP2 family protein [Sphingomonas oligophenolica]
MPRELIGAVVGALGIAGFLGLGLIVDRYPFAFDRRIMAGIRGTNPPAWLAYAARDVTALGGGVVLTTIVVVVVGFLLVQRLWLTALALALATLTGGWAVDLIKHVIVRARPDLIPHLVAASGYSFPSGHSANSAIVYLTLAALASQITRTRPTRMYLFAIAILLSGAVGISRVYLGVHWPSDVLAGWSFGTLWALGWWIATAKARAAIGGER